MFQSFGLTPSRLAPGSKKCPQARSGGSGIDFGAYFCKEVLSGIVSSKDEFSCSEFLAPTLTSSSRHRIVPKLSLESYLLTLGFPLAKRYC